MGKLNTPLLSLGAKGSLADTLTFQKRGSGTIVRSKPEPKQPNSLAQMYQRWDYQHYIAWWHAQTPAVKAQWHSDARRKRLTGFVYWMKSRLTNLTDLAARWHLDEASGALAYDSSRNANAGTIVGASAAPGYVNGCRLFDGVNDRIVVPASSSINVTDYITIAVRYYSLSVGQAGFGRLISREPATWYVYSSVINRFTFALWDSLGVPKAIATDVNSIVLNSWQTFIGTYDGAEQATYVDLVKQAAAWAWVGQLQTSAVPLVIGNRFDFVRTWDGYIDEVVIANEAWNDEQRRLFHERRYPLE